MAIALGAPGSSGGHTIWLALRWSLAEQAAFEVLLTIDQQIQYEQNLSQRKIAVILVRAKSSRLADLLPHIPEILKVLPSIQFGQLIRVGLS